MKSKKCYIPNSTGQRLAAWLDLPDDETPGAYVLFAHCFTCSKDLKAVRSISLALTREKFGVLRFDFTGLGESEGEFAETSFSSNVEDLVTAAAHMDEHLRPPALLVGHSLGGAAVLQAAARIPSARAVTVIGAPADPGHVTRHMTDSIEKIQDEGEAVVRLAGRDFRVKKQFLDDLEQTNMRQSVENLGRALLILHSPIDEIVGIDNAAAIFQAAMHPKSFISMDRADHLLSRPEDSKYAGQVIAAWARRYLPEDLSRSEKNEIDPGEVTARIGKAGFLTEIQTGRHHILADEPESVGGTGEGPTPYDLVVSGLGACTAMTLRMYADRKGWSLDEVSVRLRHSKVHARDCERCERSDGMIDRIERDLSLKGALDHKQQLRLLEISDRCPVHRTLQSMVDIETHLAGEEGDSKPLENGA
jgi:putative redox protein